MRISKLRSETHNKKALISHSRARPCTVVFPLQWTEGTRPTRSSYFFLPLCATITHQTSLALIVDSHNYYFFPLDSTAKGCEQSSSKQRRSNMEAETRCHNFTASIQPTPHPAQRPHSSEMKRVTEEGIRHNSLQMCRMWRETERVPQPQQHEHDTASKYTD